MKDVSDEMAAWKTKGTELYQQLPSEMKADAELCEPLTKIEENRPEQDKLFETWNSLKNK